MSRPDHDDRPEKQTQPAAPPAQPALSSREWLARVRVRGPIPPMSASELCPVPPSRRFTWGWRTAIVVAAVFYTVLVVWSSLDAARGWSVLLGVLFWLAVVVAVVGLVEAWCWAGRPRLSTSPAEPITAGLSPEAIKTVKRMARGRGPDVPELRARAAASAWAGQQSSGFGSAYVALGAVATLAQSGGSTVGLVLGAVVLLCTAIGLGGTLWLGHRARVLAVHLPTHPDGPIPTAGSTEPAT